MEREERWIATVREKLRGADESLPEGGWEALERDLAAAGRRRRAFTPAWKKIAAVAAVVAIAVLIGETVVNQGVVDGDRQTTFFAGELTTADGQLLYDDEPLRNEAPTVLSEAPAPLAAKVRQALAESRPAAIVAADGSVRTLSGDAVAEVRSSRSETEAAAPSDAERTAFLRTGTGEAADVGGAFRRRIADGAAGVVGAGDAVGFGFALSCAQFERHFPNETRLRRLSLPA